MQEIDECAGLKSRNNNNRVLKFATQNTAVNSKILLGTAILITHVPGEQGKLYAKCNHLSIKKDFQRIHKAGLGCEVHLFTVCYPEVEDVQTAMEDLFIVSRHV